MENVKIIYEDDYLIVIDKPAGLIVHNPPGQNNTTVVDFIVRHIPNVEKLGWLDPTRTGIVHRLDKDTSGLMITAKDPETLAKLQFQFKDRTIKKEYIALVYGTVKPEQGTIIAEIARHSSKSKQTVIPEDADEELIEKLATGTIRAAETGYETLNNYTYKKQPLTLVLTKPKTGRMHQIRIHLKHLGYPIIGDPMYFFKPSRRLSKELNLFRQFLHAYKLSFIHPQTGETLNFQSDLPEDLKIILDKVT